MSNLFRIMQENLCGVGCEPALEVGRPDPQIQPPAQVLREWLCVTTPLWSTPPRGAKREKLRPSLRVSRPLCLRLGWGPLLPFAIVPWACGLKSSSQAFLVFQMSWWLLIVFFHSESLKSIFLCFCGFCLTFDVLLAHFCYWREQGFLIC